MKKMLKEGNQIHNFISSSDSKTVINYGSGSDFLTSYDSGSASQKVTVPTVAVPQHWCKKRNRAGIFKQSMGTRNRGGIGILYRPARLQRLAEFIP
jgi:hypothetical protein